MEVAKNEFRNFAKISGKLTMCKNLEKILKEIGKNRQDSNGGKIEKKTIGKTQRKVRMSKSRVFVWSIPLFSYF